MWASLMNRVLKISDQTVVLTDLRERSATLRVPLQFDIPYAREDNFLKKKVYPAEHAFLQAEVTEDLIKAHLYLVERGYGLLIFDGYRPWRVTQLFWNSSNEHDRQFLADPKTGSSHNRGCAVDLSLYDLKNELPVQMPSAFDEMNEKSYIDYQGGDARSRELRDLLKTAMERSGFTGIKNEWWHFNHHSSSKFPILDFTFEEILQAPQSLLPLQAK